VLKSDKFSGRPVVENVICQAVAKARDSERIVIAACGPHGLMEAVRKATADVIRADGPSIEVHCEDFGW
jgi:hypothetical protein